MYPSFRSGQRIRISTVDDTGLPIIRYGTVGADSLPNNPIIVLYDDALGSDMVNIAEITSLDLDVIELQLMGADLLSDPQLRAGLAELWRAEVSRAGIHVLALFPFEKDGVAGVADGDQFLLAEFTYNGETWVVRAAFTTQAPTMVVVRADRMNRWNGFIH
jgi:hypothetical protein